MKIHIIAAIVLSGLLAGGCESHSVLLTGKNTLVHYQQIDKMTGVVSLDLVLVEEDHSDYDTPYFSEAQQNGNIKKVPQNQFSPFIEDLDDLGFVDLARPMPAGFSPRHKAASKAIRVENDSGQWLITNNADELSPDERKQFLLMVSRFLECYDNVFSLQVISNTDGKDIFLEEQRKLKDRSKERSK